RHRRHLLHPLHRFVPGVRQRLHPRRARRRRLDHDDEHLHLPRLLPGRRHRRRGGGLDAPPRRLLRRPLCDQPSHGAAEGGMMHPRGMMAVRWAVFALAAFIMNFPVVSTLVTSLKSEGEIASYPGFWIEAPTLENYREIFRM